MNILRTIYPRGLIIELTNTCNLSCPLCATGIGVQNRPKGKMSFEKFRRLIDENKSFLKSVCLWGWGEPFLVKDLPKMVGYAVQKVPQVWVSTNLTFIPEDFLKKLIGLNFKLIFSIDGLSPETYEKYRRGADFEKVIDNLARIVEAKKKAGTDNPHLIWQFIVMKHNEKEAEMVPDFARRRGVNEVWLKAVLPASVNDRLYPKFKPRARKYQNKALFKNDGSIHCYMIEQYPFICWDGEVVPCAFDSRANFRMGNLFKSRLESIWRGERFDNFREKFRRGEIMMCNRCAGRDPRSENIKRIKF